MKSKAKKIFLGFLIFCLLICLIGVGIGAAILTEYLKNAPSVEDVEIIPNLPTMVYDVDGELIARFMTENRILLDLNDMPKDLQNAVIAIEDHRFYEHSGISIKRILGALWADIKNRNLAQGGSTITIQLARNVFLSHEKTLSRKIWEVLYAFQLERRYTKDEILEAYMNYVYFGHGAYGFEAASLLYFGRSVDELSLAEMALLAGLPQNANRLSPYVNMEGAISRRNTVLNRMAELGYITADQAEEAKEEEISLIGLKSVDSVASYFKYMVRDYLLDKYGSNMTYNGGLTVYTTLDLDMQKAAEDAVVTNLPVGRVIENTNSTITYPQCALVSLDPTTGEIRAIVGGRGEDEYNRAINAFRAPGSSIKPFLYTAAIDNGFAPATVMIDEEVSYEDSLHNIWTPRNYNNRFLGEMTLRYALAQSTNSIAVKIADQLTMKSIISYIKKMGITTIVESGPINDLGLATALGGITKGVSPIEMAGAYAVLANQGIKITPYFISEIVDRNGIVIESNKPERELVLDEKTAYVVTDMMREVIASGTGKSANIERPAAGKTGTSDDNTDVWFVGFTPDLVTAVWVGEDTRNPMIYPEIGTIGSIYPVRIWSNYMKKALESTPANDFPIPEGIITLTVCKDSGLLACDDCPENRVITDIFIDDKAPTEKCYTHKPPESQNLIQKFLNDLFGENNENSELTLSVDITQENSITDNNVNDDIPSENFIVPETVSSVEDDKTDFNISNTISDIVVNLDSILENLKLQINEKLNPDAQHDLTIKH